MRVRACRPPPPGLVEAVRVLLLPLADLVALAEREGARHSGGEEAAAAEGADGSGASGSGAGAAAAEEGEVLKALRELAGVMAGRWVRVGRGGRGLGMGAYRVQGLGAFSTWAPHAGACRGQGVGVLGSGC
jgi:hypothetical protein